MSPEIPKLTFNGLCKTIAACLRGSAALCSCTHKQLTICFFQYLRAARFYVGLS